MPGKRPTDDEKARLLERLRAEVAAELGINGTESGNFGDVPTALCGKMGAIVRDRAEQLLKNEHVPKT
jgi:hypothetical protein